MIYRFKNWNDWGKGEGRIQVITAGLRFDLFQTQKAAWEFSAVWGIQFDFLFTMS